MGRGKPSGHGRSHPAKRKAYSQRNPRLNKKGGMPSKMKRNTKKHSAMDVGPK